MGFSRTASTRERTLRTWLGSSESSSGMASRR